MALCYTQITFFDCDDDNLDMFLIDHYASPFDDGKADMLTKTEGILTVD